jgi:hypothetical protein
MKKRRMLHRPMTASREKRDDAHERRSRSWNADRSFAEFPMIRLYYYILYSKDIIHQGCR